MAPPTEAGTASRPGPDSRPGRGAGAAAALAVLLAGCTAPGPEEPGAEPAPETVTWAGSVCREVSDVQAAVGGIGDDLSLNPLDGLAGLARARDRLSAQIAEVGSELGELRSSVAAAPDDPAAQEARDSLDDALDDVESSVAEAGDQARAALAPDSLADAISATVGAAGAVGRALGAVGDLIRTATGTASSVGGEARAAFALAPDCASLT